MLAGTQAVYAMALFALRGIRHGELEGPDRAKSLAGWCGGDQAWNPDSDANCATFPLP